MEINMGDGRIDLVLNVGVGGHRQFRAAVSIPRDLVKRAFDAGQLPELITAYLHREVEKTVMKILTPDKPELSLIPGGKTEEPAVKRSEAKLDCIKSLISKGDYYNQIVEFLLKSECLTEETAKALTYPDTITKHIILYDALEKAVATKKLYMVSYTWNVLPKEHIQIDVVSKDDHKAFTYEEA